MICLYFKLFVYKKSLYYNFLIKKHREGRIIYIYNVNVFLVLIYWTIKIIFFNCSLTKKMVYANYIF